MAIRLVPEQNDLTVYLQGEIDHHGARGMMLALDRAVSARDPRELTVDMGGVGFMDSSGIAVLLRCWRRQEETGGTMRVRHIPAQARKVLTAAGLDRIIPLDD